VCPIPSKDIISFPAKLEFQDKDTPAVSLSMDNLVMRGCILRNTRDIYGIVVYAGTDSKVI
jgi:magnesium-transporting ATPase (P-type)